MLSETDVFMMFHKDRRQLYSHTHNTWYNVVGTPMVHGTWFKRLLDSYAAKAGATTEQGLV